MQDKISTPTPAQLKKAVRNHAAEMRALRGAMQRTAVSAARLIEILDRIPGAPFAGGELYQRVDAIMGELGDAHQRLAAVFDQPTDGS